MKVEIWSDFVCPYCYIGKRRFESALGEFAQAKNVEIVYHSFELDPYADRDQYVDIHGALSQKFNISYEQAKAMNENVGRQAQTQGLTYNFDAMVPTNTFNAHRLMHYAKANGKMAEMVEILFRSYFTDGRHIGDEETLAVLAEEAGLSKKQALEVLLSDRYAEDVRSDEQDAQQLGIQGVPFYVINRKYAVSGAQPKEVFINALNRAWSEEQPLTILNNSDSATDNDNNCSDGICRTPMDK
ncbi:MAG: DsbA family oxidoreductase [Tuberibacillus sp.]